ncbi:fatty acid desaturase [Sphingorhabdus soli]|uniref:Fatty acid desaturase n=1 Tax=Flavisphingopyxis soli TaxID=2601267 RepID=A0A5C6USM9_9SPHN|nr:fatty acid desaturase family protein [Sphingorhabdus soli]TXC73878.1 fatty acid desaturase [Sphingorhabdus soli]
MSANHAAAIRVAPAKVATVRPLDIFARTDWVAVTRVSRWHGIWLIAHAWLVILASIAVTLWLWQLSWPFGLIAAPVTLAIIGGRQLGLAILMHDAAHGLLVRDRRWNNRIGQWLCAAPIGTDLHAYRAYHLIHHRHTQTQADPDLGLSAPFPVTRASLRRKFLRDLTGRTFAKQRLAQFATAFDGDTPAPADATATTDDEPALPDTANLFIRQATLRFLGVQAILLGLSLAITGGVWPFVLWFVALATTFPLFLRVRNIAEHACTPTDSGDPFSHARTTRAGMIARATVAPYWVNFHSEHHLFMGVPCAKLPRVHALLAADHHARMTIAPSYRAVLASVVRP